MVDTCLLLDIGLNDPQFASGSELLLDNHRHDGLVICPVSFVELAPAFAGQIDPLEKFLFNLVIDYREDWVWQDTRSANLAWARHTQLRRAKQAAKRPVADVLIGAFASRFQGLLTRNAVDFSKAFPKLTIVVP